MKAWLRELMLESADLATSILELHAAVEHRLRHCCDLFTR
jgi:hypothetical protein